MDDDSAGLIFEFKNGVVLDDETASYSVRLSARPFEDDSITVEIDGAGDSVVLNPGSLTFDHANRDVDQNFTVMKLVDCDEAVCSSTLAHNLTSSYWKSTAGSFFDERSSNPPALRFSGQWRFDSPPQNWRSRGSSIMGRESSCS